MGSFVDRLPPVRTYREIRRDFDRLVLVLAAGDLVANFGFALVFPFLTIYLVEHLGASAAQAGVILALYSICSIVSGAAGGWLADRVGRRPVMIVSVGLTGVVVGVMGFATDLATIALLTVALGIVDPAFVPAARAAVTDVVPEERRPRAFSLLSVANAVGWIAGPTIGAGLASLGYDILFLISGALIGAYALIAIVWLPETKGRSAARPATAGGVPGTPATATATAPTTAASAATMEPAARIEEAPVVIGLEPQPMRTSGGPGRDASAGARRGGRPGQDDARIARMRRRTYAAFLFIALAAQGAIFLWVSLLPVHASADLGITTATWGLLFSLNGILIVVLQLRITSAAERRSRTTVMAGGMILYAAAMTIVALASQPSWAAIAIGVAVILITCGEMLFFPMEASFVSDLSPVDRRGRYQGFLLAATGTGTALGPPIGGVVLDVAPGPALWVGAAGIFVACSAALLLLGRATRGLPAVQDDESGEAAA